jgi:hypothetical protein
MNRQFWQGVFLSKGVINWIESVGLLLLDPWLRERFNLTPLVNWEYAYSGILPSENTELLTE